ncbi:MAG: hypothetical protein Q8P32_00410 [Candidatus Komeilibacteria bacterium]|nr:hypothetical protein [Candidatus Komeilibacteria bacterium]
MSEAKIEQERPQVDFSKCQLDKVAADYYSGRKLEIETFSPYLADYDTAQGKVWSDNLTETDKVGLAVGKVLNEQFSQARVISLYDEYNSNMPDTADSWGKPVEGGRQIEYTAEAKEKFKTEVARLLKESGSVKADAKEGEDYLLVSESSKQQDAVMLVDQLEAKGCIIKKGEQIIFSNPAAENPKFKQITLRTAGGRWLCEALDASSYLKPENMAITHLVVLPESFKDQQDKVWEMLRVLGIEPSHYHNIFYNEKQDPAVISQTIKEEVEKYKQANHVPKAA